MARVLVAEDEDGTRLSLSHVLRREGYEVDEAADGVEAERLGLEGEHALAILDVEMPGLSGIEVCRRLRAARPTMPIMMLTGRDSEFDAINGLDAGADDYVSKPFRLAELLARVRAHVRRSLPDVKVDKLARRAWHGEAELALSPREFDLLTFLVANAGRTVTREEVMNAVWDGEWQGSNKTLDMNVVALRRKLGDDAKAPTHVVTVRGVGLRFES
jgi:DNA-binding response OmpR family regulator